MVLLYYAPNKPAIHYQKGIEQCSYSGLVSGKKGLLNRYLYVSLFYWWWYVYLKHQKYIIQSVSKQNKTNTLPEMLTDLSSPLT